MRQEPAYLLKAGFTPMGALQAGTLPSVRFLGKQEQHGTVEKGRFADLVLLDANPLEGIRTT